MSCCLCRVVAQLVTSRAKNGAEDSYVSRTSVYGVRACGEVGNLADVDKRILEGGLLWNGLGRPLLQSLGF